MAWSLIPELKWLKRVLRRQKKKALISSSVLEEEVLSTSLSGLSFQRSVTLKICMSRR
jgi:hypothetical protein